MKDKTRNKLSQNDWYHGTTLDGFDSKMEFKLSLTREESLILDRDFI